MSAYLGWFASRFGQKSALLWQPGNVCFSDSKSTLAIIKYESQMKTDLKRSRLVRDLKMDYHQSQFCKHCRSTALGSNAFCNSTRRFTPDSVLMSITPSVDVTEAESKQQFCPVLNCSPFTLCISFAFHAFSLCWSYMDFTHRATIALIGLELAK